MLTRRQHLLLTYLRERAAESGEAPSFAEMARAMGLGSKGGVHRLVLALEERGYVRRLARRARAIEVVAVPHGAVQPSAAQLLATRLVAEVLEGTAARAVEAVHPGWCGRARALLVALGGATGASAQP